MQSLLRKPACMTLKTTMLTCCLSAYGWLNIILITMVDVRTMWCRYCHHLQQVYSSLHVFLVKILLGSEAH